MTPQLEEALSVYVPTADELDPRTQYIVDGSLLRCWSWASNPELYSGKHKTTGLNVQVVCDLNGRPAWISASGGDMTATISALPTREDIDRSINEQLIVELYSK